MNLREGEKDLLISKHLLRGMQNVNKQELSFSSCRDANYEQIKFKRVNKDCLRILFSYG